MARDKRIGITSTVPVEIIYAAGLTPVDLNNLLVSSPDPSGYLDRAERAGMPRNVCAWTKGIFEAAGARGIRRIVGVVEGDCSNTKAVMERWGMEGFDVVPFAYPYDRSRGRMLEELNRFAERLGASLEHAETEKRMLDGIRRQVRRVDELTWEGGLVTGGENHLWQVSCSDFWGDPAGFAGELGRFLLRAGDRRPVGDGIRIGYAGVPPIVKDLYGELERMGFLVVYNEVQRQFSMPGETGDLAAQYLAYTYPYDIGSRLEDIRREVKRREIRGVVHYVQSFCHRAIEDYLVRKHVGVPVLTLECDRPGPLDERSRIRLEAFAEMLQRQPKAKSLKLKVENRAAQRKTKASSLMPIERRRIVQRRPKTHSRKPAGKRAVKKKERRG